MPSPRKARHAAAVWNATAAASASVIAARMLAFSDPASLSSPWHRAEAQRMAREKFAAAQDGALAATMELAWLPARLWQHAARPASWTPAGWMEAWTACANDWLAVGSAALRPARDAAVRNRSRLARTRRR